MGVFVVLGMCVADVCGFCSLLPDGIGGDGALFVGGGVLRVCAALAVCGRIVGCRPVVRFRGWNALLAVQGAVVLVLGVRANRVTSCQSVENVFAWMNFFWSGSCISNSFLYLCKNICL